MDYKVHLSTKRDKISIWREYATYDLRGLPLLPVFAWGGGCELLFAEGGRPRPRTGLAAPLPWPLLEPFPPWLFFSACPLGCSSPFSLSSSSLSSSSESDESLDFFLFLELLEALTAPFLVVCLATVLLSGSSLPAARVVQ